MTTTALLRKGDAELIEALLEVPSIKDAAEKAGVSYSTARRRLADEDFRRHLVAAYSSTLAAVVVGLSGRALRGVEVIGELLESDAAREPGASVRLKAAIASFQALRDLGAALAQADLAAELDELRREVLSLASVQEGAAA